MAFGVTGVAKGRTKASGMTTDASRAEKIRDVKETLRCNKYLIKYYTLLLDDAPENHLNFAAYLKEIDERGNAIKEERRILIASFDKASNGEIPDLERQQIELQQKLKTLRAELSPEQKAVKREKKVEKMKVKAKSLREKLIQLEKELKEDGFSADDLIDAL